MSFVTQATLRDHGPVLAVVFQEFADWTGNKHAVTQAPFPGSLPRGHVTYGSDKPDLRNPLKIVDITEVFARTTSSSTPSRTSSRAGWCRPSGRPIGDRPRSFFDKLNDWARARAAGAGYILFQGGEQGSDRQVRAGRRGGAEGGRRPGGGRRGLLRLRSRSAAAAMAARRDRIRRHGRSRDRLFKFCWIVDFPMYELDEKTDKVEFSDPFSMPQGGLKSLDGGIRWSPGVPVRLRLQQRALLRRHPEHDPEIMEKAFNIVGYGRGAGRALRRHADGHGLRRAAARARLRYRPHRHARRETNLREINAFVMNGQFEDLMMGAPWKRAKRLGTCTSGSSCRPAEGRLIAHQVTSKARAGGTKRNLSLAPQSPQGLRAGLRPSRAAEVGCGFF